MPMSSYPGVSAQVFPCPVSQSSDQATHGDRARNWDASHLATPGLNSKDRPDGFPSAPGPLVLADVPEVVKRSEEKNPDEERSRS
jgi:hypothetical protein